MFLLVWCLLLISCSSFCSEKSGTILSIPEVEVKHATQRVSTMPGVSSFKPLSMYRKTLQKKLVELMDSTPLPTVCAGLVLEYYKVWKKYAEIPTHVVHCSSQRRAVFLQYKGQECLLVEDSSTAWKTGNVALNLWNLRNGSLCEQTPRQQGGIIDLCVTPDGTKVIFCAHDYIIRIHDTHTFRELRTLLAECHYFYGGSMTVSPDSQFIAAVIDDRNRAPSVCLWKIATGEEIAKMAVPRLPVSKLFFSDDGNILHGQSIVKERGVQMFLGDFLSFEQHMPGSWRYNPPVSGYEIHDLEWNLTTKELTKHKKATNPSKPSIIAESPDKSLLVHDGGKGTISITSNEDGATLAEISCSGKKNGSISFSQDGECIAVIHQHSGSALLIQNTYDVDENLTVIPVSDEVLSSDQQDLDVIQQPPNPFRWLPSILAYDDMPFSFGGTAHSGSLPYSYEFGKELSERNTPQLFGKKNISQQDSDSLTGSK